jgi:hypothetical protein
VVKPTQYDVHLSGSDLEVSYGAKKLSNEFRSGAELQTTDRKVIVKRCLFYQVAVRGYGLTSPHYSVTDLEVLTNGVWTPPSHRDRLLGCWVGPASVSERQSVPCPGQCTTLVQPVAVT